MDKRLYHIGILAQLALLVLSVVFYKERTIFVDNAFFLFEIIKDGDFTVQRYRFIAAIPQMLPLAAMLASLSLKWVLVAYSLSFALYHFICYVICGSLLKNYKLALVLLLSHLIVTTHTFFWHLSELLLGMSMMLPFFALLLLDARKKINPIFKWTLLVIGLTTIVFSHPLIVLPFAFTWTFFFIRKDLNIDKRLFIIIAGIFVIIAGIKGFFFTDQYESDSINYLKSILQLFPNYFSTYSNTRFFDNWFEIYYWLPILFTWILISYTVKRDWIKFALVFFGCLGLSQMVNISYYAPHTPDFYRENMYVPLGLFLAYPLIYDVLPSINKKLFVGIFILLIATGLYRVYDMRAYYQGRIDWYRGYMVEHQDRKIIGSALNMPQETILMSWASCYEFWLLSTLENDKSASIILEDDVDAYGWAWEEYRGFVTHWGVYKYKDLDPRYFKFTDTQTHYSVIKE